MAVQTMTLPPLFVDNTEFNADPVRRVLSELVNGKPGFFGDSVFGATVNADRTVTVSPGVVALPAPTESFKGVFLAELAASVTLPIAPPHATQARRDALVAYVVPPAGANPGTWVLEVRTGTPATSPVAPSVPGSLLIHEIAVPPEAASTLPTLTDKRQTNGQVIHAGTAIVSAVRPSGVRAGTLWLDVVNGNVWLWSGTRWAPVGVPTFPTETARNTAFDAPVAGQMSLTTAPHTVWCYTGAAKGWLPVADTDRAHHHFVSTGSSAGAGTAVMSSTGMVTGHDGGIATVSGQTFKLNRPGRWHIGVMAYSDCLNVGLSSVRLECIDGPFGTADITNTGWRGGGMSGGGQLHQNIAWTGTVNTAQAALPFKLYFGWTPQTGSSTVTYTAFVVLEYLGR
ncbi:MAG TPA: hypothetical protein VM677_27980 [Actinokineospora sp.]|nr:hypothetical protein [Actinokineospora sp.]